MNKRTLSIVLAFLMIFTLFPVNSLGLELNPILPKLELLDTTWDGTNDQVWSGGGTKLNPYLIATAAELAGLAKSVNAGNNYNGINFKLTADLKLNSDSLREWMPIGDKNHLFRGIFDGGGHTISGLYINHPNDNWLGLFGGIGTGGTISNIGIIGGLIYGKEGVGAITGYNSGLIEKCYYTGEIYAKGDYVGGLVGENIGAIVDSYNTGKITGVGSADFYIGGVAGDNLGGAIIGCYNTGVVTGQYRIGGIAGRNRGSGVIFNCWNIGKVISTHTETGGITGHNGTGCIVANSYNSGDIKGKHRVGGITGYNYAGVTINCYNIGYITGNSGETGIGAIVGYNDDNAANGSGFMGGYDVPVKVGYVVNNYWLAGCIDAGRKSGVGANDDNCSIIGMGKFTSPSSKIIASDTKRGGSSLLSELIEGAFGKVLEVAIEIVCEKLDIDIPEALKNISINIDSQPAFDGNSTTYNGTLLKVLNQGVGADVEGNYGGWYQYIDTNVGYPILVEKTNPIFTPVWPSLKPADLLIFSPIIENIIEESEVEETADSAPFTLSDKYPVDRTLVAGATIGFSISLAQGSANPANLIKEWHILYGSEDYYISESMELFGCYFEFVNDNLLQVKAGASLSSGEYQVYCIVSNESTTITSRKALLKVQKTEMPIIPNEEGQYIFPFTDIKNSEWYRGDIEIAHKNGLISGKTSSLYYPDDNMTVAEAIKLAACMHQLYNDGKVTLTIGSPNWYSSYLNYAITNNIIGGEYPDYNARIKRQEFVNIFYNALSSSEYTAINTVNDNAIPDVSISEPYGSKIYAFYRAGILTGNDSNGTFNPLSNIKRSEVAAILTRMFDHTVRKSITLTVD